MRAAVESQPIQMRGVAYMRVPTGMWCVAIMEAL